MSIYNSVTISLYPNGMGLSIETSILKERAKKIDMMDFESLFVLAKRFINVINEGK